jgi:hypothetical protein
MTRRSMWAVSAAALAAGKRRRMPPMDESATDAAFVRFLTALRAVAQNRDAAGLRALCAPNVITGIDSPPGPAELVKKMAAGGWGPLQAVLRLGAARTDGGFVFPYFFERFPEDLEAFEHVVVIRANAVLRAAGRADAAVVATLDFDILRAEDRKPGETWIQAARLDGPKGWVAASDVRSLGAERLFAGKVNGAWRITAWAMGD